MANQLDEDGIEIKANLGEMYNNYEGLSYQLGDALAEFIDNSVDSYIKNKDSLKEAGREIFDIEILLNNANKTLKIRDNAFGMDKDELKNALIPDRKNPDPHHLGMYGRGLKTAAGWFGKYWTITTKKLGSDIEYTATVDILKLLESEGNNYIPITAKSVPGKPNQSYTHVEIKQGVRDYFPATQAKAKMALSIKYQRLLGSEIQLSWKASGEEKAITYSEPEIYTLPNPEYDPAEADASEDYDEPEIIVYDFPCEFDIVDSDTGKIKATLKGRYGIYPPQAKQTPYAGLTMFWKNRVIVDRTRNYWPEVFGAAAGDLKRQRLFVQLDTDMDPTSDKKDFKWDKYSFDELDAALSLLHSGNVKKVAEVGKNLSTKKDKQLTDAQILAELLRLKELLESQATTDALLRSHPILQSGIGGLTDEEENILDEEETSEINIQINQGTPTLSIKNSQSMHSKDNFCKIKLDPVELKIKVYVNQKHPFYVEYCKESVEAHALFLKMISCLALARWSANSSTEEVPIDSYLNLLNEYLESTAKNSEMY